MCIFVKRTETKYTYISTHAHINIYSYILCIDEYTHQRGPRPSNIALIHLPRVNFRMHVVKQFKHIHTISIYTCTLSIDNREQWTFLYIVAAISLYVYMCDWYCGCDCDCVEKVNTWENVRDRECRVYLYNIIAISVHVFFSLLLLLLLLLCFLSLLGAHYEIISRMNFFPRFLRHCKHSSFYLFPSLSPLHI